MTNRKERNKDYYKSHKDQLMKRFIEWRRNNPERYKLIQSRYAQKIRHEIHTILGGKCVKCGYSGLALQIDHINNDGTKDKKMKCKSPSGGTQYMLNVLRDLKAGSRGYQLLCANCNQEKELLRRQEKLRAISSQYLS